ncbi:hypothetical protein [Oceanobacillus sp. Castelsardo]|uniref:hypothetical protein n=1 Tax=Oceanobacillus sp. Castelsardo TaxID=1851204 RepID=UPI000839A30E|nr:hypothetical protein [Oceanobacillus sp. Castelsardo]
MDAEIQRYFASLESQDKQKQYEAYNHILEITEKEVEWAYEVWDQLVKDLTDRDNHKRSRAAQFLSSLAISDPEKRIVEDFPEIWEVTKDPKFVTARHSLQSIWKIGLAGEEQKKLILHHLSDRFKTCTNEKNYTLRRFDIIQGMKNLYDMVQDEEIKELALGLIEMEEDNKYKKKYALVWK